MLQIKQLKNLNEAKGSCDFCNSTFSVHHILTYGDRQLRVCKGCMKMYFLNKTPEEQEENFKNYFLKTKRIVTKVVDK